MEPQLRDAASKLEPQECLEIAKDLLDDFHSAICPELAPKDARPGFFDPPARPGRTTSPKSAEDPRQNHPEVFKRIMADKPFLVRWLSSCCCCARARSAGKLMNRAYDH